MIYIYKKLYIISFFIIIIFSLSCWSQKITLQLLMREPDLPVYRDLEKWKTDYIDLVNNYLEQKYINNDIAYNVEVAINFYPYFPVNEVFTSELNEFIINTFGYWMNSTFDLGIFDDRLLYSEFSLMESDVVRGYFKTRKPSIDYFVDLTKYIPKKELEYNDPEILNNSYYDGHIYALPYERDFDILYYLKNNEKSNYIAQSMENLNWEEFLALMNFQTKDPLAVPLGDDDDLLNFLFEYVNTKYNTSEDKDKNYYDQFVNEKSEIIFKSFYDFVITYTKNQLNHTIRIGYDEAYSAFLERQLTFYKGKASHYQVLLRDFPQSSENTTVTDSLKSDNSTSTTSDKNNKSDNGKNNGNTNSNKSNSGNNSHKTDNNDKNEKSSHVSNKEDEKNKNDNSDSSSGSSHKDDSLNVNNVTNKKTKSMMNINSLFKRTPNQMNIEFSSNSPNLPNFPFLLDMNLVKKIEGDINSNNNSTDNDINGEQKHQEKTRK